MSAEKVVALPGYSVPVPQGQPVANVVAILQEFLDKANAGLVVAVAVAVVLKPDTSGEMIQNDFTASCGQSWNLESSINSMVRKFAKVIDGDGGVSTK